MKFTSSFLVYVAQLTLSEWICLCPTLSLKSFAPTRVESIKAMRLKLVNYMNTHGAYYINSIGRTGEGVNCPEGLLNLPFDAWNCKLDKQMCKLQAWIPVNDREQFVAGCHAPSPKQEDIYRIVTEGIYKGVHHKPGRYLCPTCKEERYTSYRYFWELTTLSHFVDTNSHDFRKALIENGMSMSVISSNLCPECFIRIVSTVRPNLVNKLESIQLSFMNEPFQSDDLGDSQRASENAHPDFVAALLESQDNSWRLGLALASLYDQEEYAPDFGDALTLAGDWLGLTAEEVTDICNDEDESKTAKLHRTADSVAWRAGWAVLCGGLNGLLRRGWKSSS